MPGKLLAAARRAALLAPVLCAVLCAAAPTAYAQEVVEQPATELIQNDSAVGVDEVPGDDRIRDRLQRIYAATGWYQDLDVRVEEGVVFLNGVCASEDQCEWATNLARRTEGVVGVANRMTIDAELDWNVAPAWQTLEQLARDVAGRLPLLLIGVLVLLLTLVVAWLTRRVAGRVLSRQLENRILQQVATTLVVIPVILIGLYLFLQVAGLSRLAATVLGGTGLVGLIVGIAFRDIAENFLASILISVKRPFRIGHLIRIDNDEGYVQSVTTRGTLLMTADGNHIHIPNSRIYKSTVYNYSANPHTRLDFCIGIDYADSTARAQEVCLAVLREHPAVVADPEPFVLVEQLGSSSVVLRIYFWVNTRDHSKPKVRSSVIRQVKAAIETAGLTMPDDARELIFPRPVPVRIEHADEERRAATPGPAPEPERAPPAAEDASTATEAEGDLGSDSDTIRKQAESSEQLDLGPDIVAGSEEQPDAAPTQQR